MEKNVIQIIITITSKQTISTPYV